MLGAASLAEDVTQETFITFIEHPKRYQPARGSLLTFLCAVARNLVMNHLRRYSNRFEISDADESAAETLGGTDADPLTVLLDRELAAVVDLCIASLPPLLRKAI